MHYKKLFLSVFIIMMGIGSASAETQTINVIGRIMYKNRVAVSEKPVKIKWKGKYFHGKTDSNGNYSVSMDVPKWQRSRTNMEISCCFETIKVALNVGPRMKKEQYVDGSSKRIKSMKRYAKPWVLKRTGGSRKAPEEGTGKLAAGWEIIKSGGGNITINPKSKWKLEISKKGGSTGYAGVMIKLPGECTGRYGGKKSIYLDASRKVKQGKLTVYLLDKNKKKVAQWKLTGSGWKNENVNMSNTIYYIQVLGEGRNVDLSVSSLRLQTAIGASKKEKWVKFYWKGKAIEVK